MIYLMYYEMEAAHERDLADFLKKVVHLKEGRDYTAIRLQPGDEDSIQIPANSKVICLSQRLHERWQSGKTLEYCRTNPVELNGSTIYFTYSYLHTLKFKGKLRALAQDIDKAVNSDMLSRLKKTHYKTLETISEIEHLFKQIAEAKSVVAFDFEASGLDYWSDDFFATVLSICVTPSYAYLIPLTHAESPFDASEVETVLRMFENYILGNYEVTKVGHNIKFDLHICKRLGLNELRGRFDDTMILAHLVDENRKVGLKELLDSIYPQFAGYGLKSVKDWRTVPFNVLLPYAASDTDGTLRLYIQLETALLKDDRVYKVYRNLQQPLLAALLEMEHHGQLINRKAMQEGLSKAIQIADDLEHELLQNPHVTALTELYTKVTIREQIEKYQGQALRAKPGSKTQQAAETKAAQWRHYLNLPIEYLPEDIAEKFNLNSNPQLQDLFYRSDRGFKFKGLTSTDKNAIKTILESLPEESPLREWFSNFTAYRSIRKTIATYLQGILGRLDTDDYLHGSFLQHGTVTGRLASSDPNLQNLPDYKRVSNPLAQKVCKMVKENFIAPDGFVFMQCDLSQAELRLAAEFSEDENMIEAYRNEGDLHITTAAELAKLDVPAFRQLDKDLQKNYRTKAKSANFGLLYGMQPESYKDYAKQNYGVVMTDAEARKAHKAFFKKYPKLLDYHATYEGKAKQYGYVRTLFGRKRHLPDVHSQIQTKRSDALRQAINSPIQGTQAEFTCLLLVILRFKLPYCKFVNTVHDSIILYVPVDRVEEVKNVITTTCTNMNDQMYYYFGRGLKHLNMKVDIEVSTTNWTELA